MRCLPLLLFSVLGTSFAASPAEEELTRRAKGDGSLIAMAQFCNVSAPDIRLLASKTEAAALHAAKSLDIPFDSAAYRQHALAGVQVTRQTLAYVPRSGQNYDSNCAEVREKVATATAK